MKRHAIFGAICGAALISAQSGCTMADTSVSAPAAEPAYEPTASPATLTKTQVDSADALKKLMNTRGMTLQWISWDYLGPVAVSDNGGIIRISGSQSERGGPGKVTVLGDVVSINDTEFLFRGRITITDTPDRGRNCILDSINAGDQPFAITQNRQYWRLRNFEWCDGLTDYIDIYFPAETGE